MLSKIKSCVLKGIEGHIIDVETDISNGLPSLNIVGLADTAIKEAKDRVRSSIKNSGYKFPVSKITINLSPASIKKEGSHMDLSIAVGILSANKTIFKKIDEDICFLGELSLDGTITRITGALPLVICLRDNFVKRVIVPIENMYECGVVENIDVIPMGHLREVVDFLNDKGKASADLIFKSEYQPNLDEKMQFDFSDVVGQAALRRACEVAAAGAHNFLMLGLKGSGKTMIAKRMPTILPKLSYEESLEVTKIYSISEGLSQNGLITKRPFRSPHHTISKTALSGGGRNALPGEVSLSHRGVLFLDELPEFSKDVLEILRQPMEDKVITISRLNNSYTYPAEFMLVAAMNYCPCGQKKEECRCTQYEINRYISKISGPLLDRIDIQIEASPVKYDDLKKKRTGEPSSKIRERVIKARNIQLERYKDENFYTNSGLSSKNILKYCKIDNDAEKLLRSFFENMDLSARAHDKILKVSRTIADLEGSENINSMHISEAIQYRTLDRKYWRS